MGSSGLQQYSRHVYYDAYDGEYLALCTEFPHVSAFGDTPQEALAELDVALEGAIEIFAEEGWNLPEPLNPPEPENLPSGKFLARIPRSLHAQIARRAKEEAVSQNTLVIMLLAMGIGAQLRRSDQPEVSAR